MVLVRYLYQFKDTLAVNKSVREQLGLDINGAELEDREKFNGRKSELIRLINAVLKREWEQVKHIR